MASKASTTAKTRAASEMSPYPVARSARGRDRRRRAGGATRRPPSACARRPRAPDPALRARPPARARSLAGSTRCKRRGTPWASPSATGRRSRRRARWAGGARGAGAAAGWLARRAVDDHDLALTELRDAAVGLDVAAADLERAFL